MSMAGADFIKKLGRERHPNSQPFRQSVPTGPDPAACPEIRRGSYSQSTPTRLAGQPCLQRRAYFANIHLARIAIAQRAHGRLAARVGDVRAREPLGQRRQLRGVAQRAKQASRADAPRGFTKVLPCAVSSCVLKAWSVMPNSAARFTGALVEASQLWPLQRATIIYNRVPFIPVSYTHLTLPTKA